MFQKNTGRFRPDKHKSDGNKSEKAPVTGQREETSEYRLRLVLENNAIDAKYGFEIVKDHIERTGFLLNMHTSEILDDDKRLIAAVDYYFMEEDGTRFKVSYPFMPYFFVLTKRELIQEVTQYLMKKFSGLIGKIETVAKEDLDLPNHLIGLKQYYLKLSFFNQTDMIKVRREIVKFVKKNKEREKSNNYYTNMLANALSTEQSTSHHQKSSNDHMESLLRNFFN